MESVCSLTFPRLGAPIVSLRSRYGGMTCQLLNHRDISTRVEQVANKRPPHVVGRKSFYARLLSPLVAGEIDGMMTEAGDIYSAALIHRAQERPRNISTRTDPFIECGRRRPGETWATRAFRPFPRRTLSSPESDTKSDRSRSTSYARRNPEPNPRANRAASRAP